MDGAAVNIKFLNEFKLKREENAFNSIIVIESCRLHVLHRSVKTAFKSNMKIKETLITLLQGVKIVKVFQG